MARIETGARGRGSSLGGKVAPIGGSKNVPAATRRLAGALGDIGEDIQRRHEIQRNEEDITHKNQVFNDYNNAARTFEQEQLSKTGLDSSDWEAETDKFHESLSGDVTKNTPDRLKESVNQKLEAGRSKIKDRLAAHNARELKAARETQRGLLLDGHIFNAGEAPGLLEDEIANYVNTIEEYEANGSYDTLTADRLIVEGTNEIAQASADSTLNSNPEKLIVDINEGVYDGKLTKEQKDNLTSSARTQIKAIETEQKRKVAQAEKDAKDAQKKAQAETENDYISRLDNKENPVTWTEVVKSNLEPADKLKWQGILEDNTLTGPKLTDQMSIDTYDELTSTFNSFDENTSEDVINEAWEKVRTAFGKGKKDGLSQADYNHFQARRDKAIEKADPLNSGDFKAGEARILSFGKNGGFLPWVKDDAIVPPGTVGAKQLTKDEAKDMPIAQDESQANRYRMMNKYKKWKQDNPDKDSDEWLKVEFAPVEAEVVKGTTARILDFMFGTANAVIGATEAIRNPIGAAAEIIGTVSESVDTTKGLEPIEEKLPKDLK